MYSGGSSETISAILERFSLKYILRKRTVIIVISYHIYMYFAIRKIEIKPSPSYPQLSSKGVTISKRTKFCASDYSRLPQCTCDLRPAECELDWSLTC